MNQDNERDSQRFDFLKKCQSMQIIGEYQISALKQDASFRQYYRITQKYKKHGLASYILMDAPAPMENIQPFVMIDEHLRSLALYAPKIFMKDEQQGFILLEDLGQNTFTQLLEKEIHQEASLYAKALDTLIHLHQSTQATQISLPEYNYELFEREAMLLAQWYIPYQYNKTLSKQALEEYRAIIFELWQHTQQKTDHLVLRDFHIDNLMIVNAITDIAESVNEVCALLDFQDAVLGPSCYDVISLLEDARRDVHPALKDKLLNSYIEQCIQDQQKNIFLQDYSIWAVQRHAKVLGIFCRLYLRDKKDIYLQHLPRVNNMLNKHIERNPELFKSLKNWIDQYFNEENIL